MINYLSNKYQVEFSFVILVFNLKYKGAHKKYLDTLLQSEKLLTNTTISRYYVLMNF